MEAATISRRELGKSERRRRIVQAAADLVRRDGFEAVSMVAIAERADVSPATLYNLFHTKAAIFRDVFDLDLEDYDRRVRAAPASDALERMFAAISVAARLYEAEPGFYRAMARSGVPGEPMRAAIDEPRMAWWQDQVAAAIANGDLKPTASAAALGVVLMQFMRGAFMDWAMGAITPARLEAEAAYGFALMLRAHVADGQAAALDRRIEDLERRLAAPRRGDHQEQGPHAV